MRDNYYSAQRQLGGHDFLVLKSMWPLSHDIHSLEEALKEEKQEISVIIIKNLNNYFKVSSVWF